jgi:hypothetical protein
LGEREPVSSRNVRQSGWMGAGLIDHGNDSWEMIGLEVSVDDGGLRASLQAFAR